MERPKSREILIEAIPWEIMTRKCDDLENIVVKLKQAVAEAKIASDQIGIKSDSKSLHYEFDTHYPFGFSQPHTSGKSRAKF